MKRYLIFLSLSLVIALSQSSCLKSNPTPTSNDFTAFFITQASPDAPLADLYINGDGVLGNVAYGLDTGYSFGQPGTYEIKFISAGTSTALVTGSFNFKTNGYQSVFAIDSVSKMKLVSVEDNFSVQASDSVQVRYFDFSPDAPYHYAKFVNASDSLDYMTGRSFNDQASIGSYSDFTTIKSGTYNLDLKLPGSGTPFKTIPGLVLQGGKAYTIYLRGFYNGTGTQALTAGIIQHLL